MAVRRNRTIAALFFLSLVLLLPASPAHAQRRPRRPHKTGAAQVLRGSPAALARENAVADRWRLSRIRDRAELRRFIDRGLLVPIRPTPAYALDETLGEADPDHRELYAHARPWVRAFLDDLLVEGHRLHGDRFVITSMVRTVDYQRRLRREYAAAAGATGPRSRMSSHLTGSTLDIKIMGLSSAAAAWLRVRLVELERLGAVQATEEGSSSVCFHVMVFPDYERRARCRTRTDTRPYPEACHH